MMKVRLGSQLLAVALLATTGGSVWASPSAAAAPASPPELCGSTLPITLPASASEAAELLLADGSQGCDLTGRRVAAGGLSVHVPSQGAGVLLSALGPRGEVSMTVKHQRNGALTAITEQEDGDAHSQLSSDGPVSETAAGGIPACTDIAWGDSGHKESDNRAWRYNRSTHASPGSTAATYHETAIRNGMANLVSGYNSCGLQRNFRAYNNYLGNTTYRANISNAPGCTTHDGRNTVNWGVLDGDTATLQAPLAVACTWLALGTGVAGVRDEITEADVKINNRYSWLTAAPSSTCTRRWDVQSVMTHEFGHTYGLNHTPAPDTDHRQQTMNPATFECSTFQRSLGRGDWTGMWNIYGLA